MKTINIVTLVALTGIVTGSSVYMWQNMQSKSEQDALNNQIATLQSQKSALEKQAEATTKTQTPATSKPTTTDTSTTTEVKTEAKVISSVSGTTITFPINGSEIETQTFLVEGKTKPNYQVWAYLDLNDKTITFDTFASAAGQADNEGNYTIKHTGKTFSKGTHTLRVSSAPDGSRTIDPKDVTEELTFSVN